MIYFISDGQAIKIGRSKDVEARLKDLSGANARPLALIGSVDGHSAHETKVHSDLANYRLAGEWFADCDHVRSAIARYMESGIQVRIGPSSVGQESDAVSRCRLAAMVLITRKMNAGQPKMQAYESLASEVGTNAEWLRKFVASSASAKEPRLSIGLALLESAGLLVAAAKRTD